MADGHNSGGNNRIVKFSADGEFLMSFGETGTGPGQFRDPHALAMDSMGRLFVGDRANNRIQLFDQEGNFIEEWLQFGRPSGIFITADDTIYVADSESTSEANPGFGRGIRIGSAVDGAVHYYLPDDVSDLEPRRGAGDQRAGGHRGGLPGRCLRRRGPPADGPEVHEERVAGGVSLAGVAAVSFDVDGTLYSDRFLGDPRRTGGDPARLAAGSHRLRKRRDPSSDAAARLVAEARLLIPVIRRRGPRARDRRAPRTPPPLIRSSPSRTSTPKPGSRRSVSAGPSNGSTRPSAPAP